jgi:hypothetical protein
VNRKHVRYAGIALICLLTSVGSGSASAAGQNSAPNLDNLSSFRGRVLLPSQDLGLANHLVIEQSTVTGDTYLVSYRSGNGHATVQGNAGRTVFDRAVQQATQGCSANGYCASGRSSDGGSTTEVFRNLKTRGSQAVLQHVVGGASAGWTLVWYDASTDTGYSLTLSESIGGALMAGGTDPTNVSVGNTIATMAEGLTARTAQTP